MCPYCGAGCKLKLVVDNNKIIRAGGRRRRSPTRTSCACKSYYGWDFLN
ncbi:hypothetical protein LNP74_29640 [Klebsiella pneumoniae subsp. pneumoniae]|nr:hypothetical protein [Klebsiella pneumoniae subsp. pneumoniae]